MLIFRNASGNSRNALQGYSAGTNQEAAKDATEVPEANTYHEKSSCSTVFRIGTVRSAAQLTCSGLIAWQHIEAVQHIALD
jgi:hypothetical protein